MVYGFVKSKLDGSEHIFDGVQDAVMPESFSYRNFLPEVINQGRKPICVPCSISAFLDYKCGIKNGHCNSINTDLMQIYGSRETSGEDGMTFKDALHFLRHEGVNTDAGVQKINRYAMVNSDLMLQQAILFNGPCIGGLPVYDSLSDKFWRNTRRHEFQGGHAISIVGYDNEGFVIRNSWGDRLGDNGYYNLPYDEFNCFLEIWTIY